MKVILLPFLFFAILCFQNETEQRPATLSITPNNAYEGIIGNLDPLFPGRGLDVFNEKSLDRPMAYGLILSAESNRFNFTQDSSVLNRIRLCGHWLVENSDLNEDGIYGYGLADSWDVFRDSSVNPANQEYTITTAIAIKGLLDWYMVEPDSTRKADIYNVVLKSISPYLTDKYNSPIEIPAYSLSPNDKYKDVYNPANFLAGEMKRFATISKNDSLTELLNHKSKKIVDIIMYNHQTDINNNIFWDYGVQTKSPNDLVHACLMIEGFRQYTLYNGKPNSFWKPMYNHLNQFYAGSSWNKNFEINEKNNLRLWALGMVMYSLSLEGEYDRIDKTVWPQVQDYHIGNAYFKYKPNEDRSMVRQDAYLLLGLSYYLYNENKY